MRFFVLLLFLVYPLISTSQVARPVSRPYLCLTGPNILDTLLKKYEEELQYYGKATDTDIVIEWYENTTTGTWTLIERNEKDRDNICVIDTGERKPGMTNSKKS